MAVILVVEDNGAVREGIVFALRMRGYETIEASSGSEAIEILEAHDPLPDLIVSDIDMPDIDGYQLLEEVQNNPHWQAIPFIFLTGYNAQDDISFARQQGVDDYLTKPFSEDELVAVVNNKLSRKALWGANTLNTLVQHGRHLMKQMSNGQQNITFRQTLYDDLRLQNELDSLPDEFSRKAQETLQQAQSAMMRLIYNIALLVQLDNGLWKETWESEVQSCDVEHLLQLALELVKEEVSQKDINLVFRISSEVKPVVKGLVNLLITALGEIIHNAVVHSGSQNIFIAISMNQASVNFSIRDHGTGIAAEHLPYIWQRFKRFETPNGYQGVGLGLAVAKEIIALHGGQMEIRSQSGVPTEVTIQLPCK